MTGLELAALAWGGALRLFVTIMHLCLLDAIRRGR